MNLQLGALQGKIAAAENDWWRGAVIYQIYPRSFSDSSGDGVGDLQGVTSRMDYIASLGVDAIWLSPFFPSPMQDFGYDVSDYCAVDPLFGTMADFDAMLKAAHARGVRVFIDLVLSHTSAHHPWFQESARNRTNPKADWYVWQNPRPDGTPPTNWLSVFGGSVWEWHAERKQYYLHNFLTSQPDLNFHNPQVQEAVLDVVRFWLDRGVDGFRLDTVNLYFHDQKLRDNPPIEKGQVVLGVNDDNPLGMQQPIYSATRPENLDFLKRFRALLDEYPATSSVGEIAIHHDMIGIMADYTDGDERLHMCYIFELMTREFSAGHLRRTAEKIFSRVGDGWPAWAFSNHDVMRVASRWNLGDCGPRAAPLLIALSATLKGSACLYQGEELGLTEADVPYEALQDPFGKRFWPDFKGRDGCRTPHPWTEEEHGGFSSTVPWLPVFEPHKGQSVKAQEADENSPLNRTRRFLHWRKGQDVLRMGDMRFYDQPEPLLMFVRTLDDEAMLCIFNLSAEQHSADLPAHGKLEAIDLPGFENSAEVEGRVVRLKPWGAVFARLTAS